MLNLGYYDDLVLKPNPKGDVAIVCGWTKREKLVKRISSKALGRVCAIGQLYSREGINYIIRNIFLNPQVKHLIVTGLDLSGSISFLVNFLNGDDFAEDVLHKEIPIDDVKRFIGWFNKASFVEQEKLSEKIISLGRNNKKRIKKMVEFPDPPYQEASSFPSEHVGIRLEDKKVAYLWLKILDRILRFGRDKSSQYGEMQRELIGLISVVSDEDPFDFFLPKYLTYDQKDLRNYLAQVMTKNIPEGLEYTYGSRLRNYSKLHPVDQIQSIISQLNREDYTRRAVAVTWDVEVDNFNPKSPCLDLVQALVSEGKVHLICYLRSNDMYGAWPQNAMAMRNVQKEISDATGKNMGKLMIVSASAHIYEHDYENALAVVDAYKSKIECIHDPRGNFIITLNRNKIIVKHLEPLGRNLQIFEGISARKIFDCIYPFISDSAHALYLGGELQKAEIALKQRLVFEQDNPLVF